jgi:hypothetical protein
MGSDEILDLGDDLETDIDGELREYVDEAAIDRMRTVAWILDESVRIPGTDLRFGVDPVLGVLPGAGPVIGAGVSLYIVLESARLGVRYTTLLRMLANVAVDTAGGAVPYAGVVFDMFWKANKRNFELALGDLTRDESGTDEPSEPIEITVE